VPFSHCVRSKRQHRAGLRRDADHGTEFGSTVSAQCELEEPRREWERPMKLKLLRNVFLLGTCALLAACGGGGSHSLPVPGATTATSPQQSNLQSTAVHFFIPKPGAAPLSVTTRKPAYITSSTQSIKITVMAINGAPPNPLPTQSINVTSTSGSPTTPGQCGTDPNNAGNIECTEAVSLPLGNDTLSLQTYDGPNATGNIISSTAASIDVLQGQANTISVTFSADLSSIAATSTSVGVGGTSLIGFTITVLSTVNFAVSVNDGHGSPITGSGVPGTPTITVASGTPSCASVSAPTQTPYAFTLTPAAAGCTTQITVTATDALGTISTMFNVTTASTLVAAGEAGVASGQVDLFTLTGSTFGAYGRIPASVLGTFTPAALGFDGTNELYMFDNNSNVILEFPATALAQTSGQALPTPITSGITGGNGLFSTFGLARDGSMAVGNAGAPSAPLNQISAFAPRATAPSLTLALGGPQIGYFYRAGASTVLTDTNGNAFAYGAALESDNGTVGDNTSATMFGTGAVTIVSASSVVSGSSAATCGPGSIPCFALTLTNEAGGAIGQLDAFPGLIWNRFNQELVFFDNTTGIISAYPYSAGTFGAPSQIDTYIPTDTTAVVATYAVSSDGHLAVATADASGNTILKVYDATNAPAASWSFPLSSGVPYAVFGLSFLPNDTLIVAGGYDVPADQLLAYHVTSNSAAFAAQTLSMPIASTTATLQSRARRAGLTHLRKSH
jgi:hypothetical protein